MLTKAPTITLENVSELKHIEGFSEKRMRSLAEKITAEGVWRVPLALDDRHHLVMDGQHRMEVAKLLKLKRVPAVKWPYQDVEIWSLRPKNYEFDWKEVERRALLGDIYPYKTVKHRFPFDFPSCDFALADLA